MSRPQRETTASLRSLLPFVTPPGLGSEGAYVGRDLCGLPFFYDPLRLYLKPELGVTDPNVIVLGEIGKGKSALVKCLARRLSVFGYQTLYVDPKGETAALAKAFGVSALRPTPGGGVCLNPLDAAASAAEREQLLETILEVLLARPLHMAERRELNEVVRSLPASPTLGDCGELSKATRAEELALAFWHLVHGPAAGIFDGPTTEAINFDAPLVALDLSGLLRAATGDHLHSLVLGLAAQALCGVIQRKRRRRLFVLDEAWFLLHQPATASWLQRQWKLARALGVANVAVLHRLSDLDAAGASAPLARGLVSDTQTKIVFSQPVAEATVLQAWLGLNEVEVDCVLGLPRGWALWMVGEHRFVVELEVQAAERALIDTDQAMRPDTPMKAPIPKRKAQR